ncbi:MAG: IclR family transcriptional regulator [Burkholderiales bacterium]|jgi:DNA-binding IclR family transcriptional regulator
MARRRDDASPTDAADGGSRTAIQVIDRLVSLLDALAEQPDAVSLKDLSIRTGLHPSTAHRILNDLVSARLVDRSEPGTYQLGIRLLELGNLVKARLNVRDAALGPMRELHRMTHQPVNLSIRQGDEIVYIERAVSERSGMQVVRAVGGRAPLHLTSVGKLFLAADDPRNVRAYATRTGLAGQTRNSITESAKLERELALVRARGYARDNEELELGVRCIAAGIRDDAGKLVAGLSISAPSDFLQDDWIDLLCRTAGQISAAIGFDPEQ